MNGDHKVEIWIRFQGGYASLEIFEELYHMFIQF